MEHPFSPPLSPMEARVRTELPAGDWAYEPKWDGFRALAWSEPLVRLDSRNRKPLLRYFPELEPALTLLPGGTVIDGEIVVVVDDVLAFEQLQLRLHPARSRTELLAEQRPAQFVAFDLLALEGEDLRPAPFHRRREALLSLMDRLDAPWRRTPSTTDRDEAERWFHAYEAAGCDGIVAKRRDEPYVEGERAMVKVKHRRTADVVVGGYREHKDGGRIGSLLLGLYDDDGQLHFVGHCSGFSDHDRTELLELFSRYRSDDPFGEDARRPGEDSRWSAGKDLSWYPVRPGVVVEVSYDQLADHRFRHATRFERWRPDKDAAECTFAQLERPEGPGFSEVVD